MNRHAGRNDQFASAQKVRIFDILHQINPGNIRTKSGFPGKLCQLIAGGMFSSFSTKEGEKFRLDTDVRVKI